MALIDAQLKEILVCPCEDHAALDEDEAASRLRMQVDSKPEELDAIDRDLMRLRIEREALRKEQDVASRDRLAKLEKELADLEERSNQMTQRWEAEKGKVVESQKLKEELDNYKKKEGITKD